jgi:hypothetical protein
MEDLERYVRDIVEPTLDDFREHPASVRHAFLACVAVFHGVDYLTYPDRPSKLRGQLRKSDDFKIVDDVAHAFKHVATGRRENVGLKADEVVTRKSDPFDGAIFDQSTFDSEMDGVTFSRNRSVDLLTAAENTVKLLNEKGRELLKKWIPA